MPKPTPEPTVPSRYPFDAVTQEIQRVLAWYPEGIYKRLNALLGYAAESKALSQRLRGVYSKINFVQAGVIAEEIEAPPGWPWIRWEEAKARDEAFRASIAAHTKTR